MEGENEERSVAHFFSLCMFVDYKLLILILSPLLLNFPFLLSSVSSFCLTLPCIIGLGEH